MIEHDPHTGFIAAAYLVAFGVMLTMVVVTWTDYRSLRRKLERFGPRGLDRG